MTPTRHDDELERRLADHAEALFCDLWGDPTSRRQHELRWGKKGSLVPYLHGRKGAPRLRQHQRLRTAA